MSPVRNLSLMSPNPPPRSTYHSAASTVVPAKQTAATSILLSDDIMVHSLSLSPLSLSLSPPLPSNVLPQHTEAS
jgi:hypothetical protein